MGWRPHLLGWRPLWEILVQQSEVVHEQSQIENLLINMD